MYASVQRSSYQDGTLTVSVKDYLLSSFLSELPIINSKLPFKIDDSTVLLSIEYANNKVISRYQILNYKVESNQDWIKNLTLSLRKKECVDDAKKNLIDVGVDFLNRYEDAKGLAIFEVLVSKSLCSEVNSEIQVK